MKTFTHSTTALHWQDAGAPGIFRKMLNQHADTGAQTLLLRSAARPGTQIQDRRPQYHPVDEEFLCLSGRFTLEGTHWLTPMTYVYYPPGLVHGFGVDVPDGYEIYLRNSGPLETARVDEPAREHPYFIGDANQQTDAVIVSDCSPLVRDAVRSSQSCVIALRHNDRTHEGAMLACLPAQVRIESRIHGPQAYAELFVLQGKIGLTGLGQLGEHGYAFVAGPRQLHITSLEPAVVMLNYRADGLASDLAQQTASLRHCINAYGAV